MCANYKSAFTLAETIMVLAIVGVVITAAIPALTSKMLMDNGKMQSYCAIPRHANEAKCVKLASNNLFTSCGTANSSLCTNSTSYLVIGARQLPAKYDDFSSSHFGYFPLTFVSSTNPLSLYTDFLSARNMVRIADYYMQESGSNFFLTKDINSTNSNALFPTASNMSKNTIIGKVTDNTASITPNTFQNNTILGGGNNLMACNGRNLLNNIVYGPNNVLCNQNNPNSNSLVIGDTNYITGSNSLVVGLKNVTPNISNVLYIGNTINDTNDFNRVPDLNDLDLSIEGIITSRNTGTRTINFSHNTEISGTFEGIFLHNSDIRFKNINGSYQKGLKEVLKIEPVRFYYNNDDSATEQIGVIAQDVQKIFPEAVVKMPTGYLGVDTDPIFFAMVNALKEINDQTIKEERRHEQLKNELEQLEKQLNHDYLCNSSNFILKFWCWLKQILGGNHD